jgi:DNA-binding PadR family transcriptional regulator
MSAKHAILGLVIERPGYGYELARRLEERCAAWGWEGTGVYSILDRLERDGHIRSPGEKRSGATTRGAPRVIYEATPEGEDFFRDWVCEPTPPSPVRQELDLKILLSGPECIERLIDHTCAQEQQCIDDLRALTRASQGSPLTATASWRETMALLQRDSEMKHLTVRIEWLQNVREVLKQKLGRPDERRRR